VDYYVRMKNINEKKNIRESLVKSVKYVMNMWREKWCKKLEIIKKKSDLNEKDVGRNLIMVKVLIKKERKLCERSVLRLK
jgi:hypothetical protein